MSCDGLYLISLKGRQPQRLPSGNRWELAAWGPVPLLFPPCCVLLRPAVSPAWLRTPNQTGNTGWKAWRCSQSCLEPHQRRSGRTAGIGSASGQPQQHQVQSRGLAWEKIRQPKKPFPSLPCFWSGRRAWGAHFGPDHYSIQYFVLSFAAASNNILTFYSSCRRGGDPLLSLHCRLTVPFVSGRRARHGCSGRC